ncbi:Replication factor C large subunit [Methanosarcina siciliae T4/M]|uniref:Replication factor C large subunit n=2 Tax=Methanosarcina siciliae TaxID=38027 RepID=A0A0E3PG50_9EURY|nr:Replication factor C large subunit [Methanosarcina siciliae T4/M]AKB32928.1 Replication factor C large subunit [Methanosarcina siciliae HI350]
MAIEWAEKYRPQTLEDVVGNKKAVRDFRAWAEEWQSGIPETRAVILYGPAGIGKTSSAHALARDMEWDVIELNASDQRTAGVIEKIAGSAASMNSLFGSKRLIILDEADNIHGTADRGGMRAISGIIKGTLQPIVLIANDIYGLTPTIRNLCLEIKFGSVQSRSMVPALKKVCKAEEVNCSQEALLQIAENAGGDFRSAMNDLQAAANGKEKLEVEDIGTAERDVKENIFKAMQKIFKSTDCRKALESAYGLDESPEDLVHWIDENLPIQYARKDGNLEDIRTGFGYISKADLYLGRVKKRQNYRMWRYASMLMVCGAALSKTKPYPGFIKYQQPSLWKRLGQTRSKRDMRDNIASKIGEHSFESMHYSRNNLLGFYSRMLKDEESAVEVTANLRLELEELMYLTGSTKASKKLQKIYDEAQKLLEEGKDETADPDFFKAPMPAVDNKQKTLNIGFNSLLETSEKKVNSEKKENYEEKENSGKLPVDDSKPAEKNLFSFSTPLPEKKALSESVEQKTSSKPSKKGNPSNNEPFKQKILDKVSPSESVQDSTGDGAKKAEPKNQKTLFDF